MKLLRIENLVKIQDNFTILDNINFEANKNEIYGLISDNQNNLTSLINIIGGIEKENSGNIFIKSNNLNIKERIKKVGIARKNYQLVKNFTALENIFLGISKKYSKFGLINKNKMKVKANDILNKFQTHINLNNIFKNLNQNEKLIIEISRVLAKDCDCYIFDHVTAYMSLRQFDSFANILKELKTKEKCIVVLPDTVEDIRTFIDRLYFFKNSRLYELKDFNTISNEKLNEMLLSTEKLQIQHVYDPIYKAKMTIEKDFEKPFLEFEKIAESVCLSYETFRRKFKYQIGLSPNQFFIKIKLDKAKELLLYSNLEIKEIAENLGFSDPYYFSRLFKEKEKISPMRFREKKIDSIYDQ